MNLYLVQQINTALAHMINKRIPVTKDNLIKHTGIVGLVTQMYITDNEAFIIVHPVESTVYIKAMVYFVDGNAYVYRVEGNGYGKIYTYGLSGVDNEYLS